MHIVMHVKYREALVIVLNPYANGGISIESEYERLL